MHGICFDYPLQDWFDFKVPKTKIHHDYIYNILQEDAGFAIKPSAKLVWTGGKPITEYYTKSKKGRSYEMASFTFHDRKETYSIQLDKEKANWLSGFLDLAYVGNANIITYARAKQDFENQFEDFELFWFSKPIAVLRQHALLVL
jgi:hypothetical protein